MKSFVLKITLVVIGIFIFATTIPIFGEDYLVIKKKGGPTQKVPLKFSPDQIESFQVESAEPSRGEKAKQSVPPTAERGTEGRIGESPEEEGKPLEIRPGRPQGPAIAESAEIPGSRSPAGMLSTGRPPRLWS